MESKIDKNIKGQVVIEMLLVSLIVVTVFFLQQKLFVEMEKNQTKHQLKTESLK